MNPGHRHRDLAGDEGLSPPRRLVVEEDAVAGVQPVGLPVVPGDPEAVQFGGGVRRPRIERGGLALGNFLYLPEEFRGRRLIETGGNAGLPDGVEQPQYAERVAFGGVLRHFEGDLDV